MDNALFVIIITVVAFLIFVAGYYLFSLITLPKRLAQIEEMLKARQYNAVIREIKSMIAKRSNASIEARLHYYMAEAYNGTKNLKLAIDEYLKALRNGKGEGLKFEVDIRMKMATIYLGLNQVAEALNEYLTITKLDMNNHEPFYEAGRIYLANNDLENAIKYLKLSSEINHRHVDTFVQLGLAYFRGGREVEALKAFLKALRDEPSNERVHLFVGRIYRKSKDYPKAIDEFSVVADGANYRREGYLEMGMCYMDMEDLSKAAEIFEKGLKLPQKGDRITLETRYALAHCYEETRNITGAIMQWKKIAKVDKEFKDVAMKLATYADAHGSGSLISFLMASPTEYEALTRKVVTALDLEVLELRHEANGDMVIRAQIPEDPNAVKKSISPSRFNMKLIHVNRDKNKTVSELDVRTLLDEAKTEKIGNTIYITAGRFGEEAITYSDSRPIDLIDSSGLENLLQRAEGKA